LNTYPTRKRLHRPTIYFSRRTPYESENNWKLRAVAKFLSLKS
jgi:hypothetical protein